MAASPTLPDLASPALVDLDASTGGRGGGGAGGVAVCGGSSSYFFGPKTIAEPAQGDGILGGELLVPKALQLAVYNGGQSR